MIVNGIDIEDKYKGNIKVLNQSIEPRNVITYTDWLDDAFDLIIHKDNKYRDFEVHISILLSGDSMQKCEMIRSEMLRLFQSGVIRLDDMNMTCDFVFKSESITMLNKWRYSYELTLTAYNKKGSQEIINFTGTDKVFTADATAISPAVIKITSNIGLNTLTITGMTKNPVTIQNIAINSPIIIDGEKCTIEENGNNIFGRTDLWEFPVIRPGTNTIRLSSACTCTLTYKPRYL